MAATDVIEEIQRALGGIRLPAVGDEYDLHLEIANALTRAGLAYVHEARLGPRRRIDFLIGDVGVEAKRGKVNRKLLLAQIARYAETGRLKALIIVSTRALSLPAAVAGVQIVSFGLNRLWGVALP